MRCSRVPPSREMPKAREEEEEERDRDRRRGWMSDIGAATRNNSNITRMEVALVFAVY